MCIIRIIKAELLTPSCRECANYDSSSEILMRCKCRAYLDHVERTECIIRNSAFASDVRGTAFCKFERATKGEGGKEARE